ncbi:hypothetical protein [Blastococcus sp. SYSU DS0973]
MARRDETPTGATSLGADQGPTTPAYSDRPVAFRGPESLGGLLLILAGIAAAVSLPLDWLRDRDDSGWGLVRDAFGDLGEIVDDGGWQPLAIVLGGGLLLLLGIVLWLPARSHRFVGFVALVVSGVVTAAVLVPLLDAGFDLGFFGPGFWCGIAVAVLGLLGSLKAVLTGPRYPR